jgi:hypothetical protein
MNSINYMSLEDMYHPAADALGGILFAILAPLKQGKKNAR